MTAENKQLVPCWEFENCIDVKNDRSLCPAVEAWNLSEGRRFCFEVASGFCAKIQNEIRGGGTLATCPKCDYFKHVSGVLETGEAMQRLIDAKLKTDADMDKYEADRASMDVDIESREEFLVKYAGSETDEDRMILLEERMSKIQLRIGQDQLRYAECYHWIRNEQDRLKKLLTE